MAKPLELAGFWLSGLVCVVLAVLKLTVEAQWSWWRVWLSLWAVLGHNILNIMERILSRVPERREYQASE